MTGDNILEKIFLKELVANFIKEGSIIK